MITLSQCDLCARGNGTVACPAFPSGIPDEILDNKFDHNNPHEGDGGMRFLPLDEDALETQKSFFAQGQNG